MRRLHRRWFRPAAARVLDCRERLEQTAEQVGGSGAAGGGRFIRLAHESLTLTETALSSKARSASRMPAAPARRPGAPAAAVIPAFHLVRIVARPPANRLSHAPTPLSTEHLPRLCLLVTACSDSGTEPKPANPTASSAHHAAGAVAPAGREGHARRRVCRRGRPPRYNVRRGELVEQRTGRNSVDAAGVVGPRDRRRHGRARSGSLKGSADVTVLPPAPLTGSNTPVSATIDTAGGTITAVASDGTLHPCVCRALHCRRRRRSR